MGCGFSAKNNIVISPKRADCSVRSSGNSPILESDTLITLGPSNPFGLPALTDRDPPSIFVDPLPDRDVSSAFAVPTDSCSSIIVGRNLTLQRIKSSSPYGDQSQISISDFASASASHAPPSTAEEILGCGELRGTAKDRDCAPVRGHPSPCAVPAHIHCISLRRTRPLFPSAPSQRVGKPPPP